MKINDRFTLLFVRIVQKLLGLRKVGSGTALPGLIIEKYIPSAFERFAGQLDTIILITGTNGKTTTKAIMSEIFQEADIEFVSNKSGSNMKRGILSAFLENSNLSGKLRSKTGIFEVEEATLPRIVDNLKPSILIVTNLFRDQLDAYGEVNKTREYIRDAIEKSPEAKVILNGDDPLVSTLTKNLPNETLYFSIAEKYRKNISYEGISTKNGSSDILQASKIVIQEDLSSEFQADDQTYLLKTPGIYHVYNALAAILSAELMEIDQAHISNAIQNFKSAFGRGETIEYRTITGKKINFKILLIKNPAGFTLTLDLLKRTKGIKLLLILNDKIADGRDVSWIWDSEVEKLNDIQPNLIITSGTRAHDMALRIKYSLKESEQNILVRPNIRRAILSAGKRAKQDETIYVLPTYTAMNEFRKLLGKKF